MSQLQAGPELDTQVAEQVMGVKHVAITLNGVVSTDFSLPYSISIEYAWQVVERLQQHGYLLKLRCHGLEGDYSYYAVFRKEGNFQSVEDCVARTVPHAICLAALAIKS